MNLRSVFLIHRKGQKLLTASVLLLCMQFSSCGGGGSSSSETQNTGDTQSPSPSPAPRQSENPIPTPTDSPVAPTSNVVLFTYDCDLQGVNAELLLTVEVIAGAGIIWGSGPNPDITGVIGTGSYTYITSGTLRSPQEQYIFTGENNFADFTTLSNGARFLVQWQTSGEDLVLLINPFGPGPTTQNCVYRDAEFI